MSIKKAEKLGPLILLLNDHNASFVSGLPAGSEYGSQCCGCPGFQKKQVMFWFVINVAHFVPELWRSMDSTVWKEIPIGKDGY